MSSNEPSTSAYEGSLLILDIFLYLGSLMISILYYAGMNASKWQGTLGKMIVGIQITDLNGQPNFLRTCARSLFRHHPINYFYIGYIMAAFTKKEAIIT